MRNKIIFPLALIAFLAGCPSPNDEGMRKTVSDEDLKKTFIKTDNTDVMWECAGQLTAKGKDGIPILLDVLSSIRKEDRYSVIEYGRLAVCIVSLHKLAKDGQFTYESVPILIDAFEKQIDIAQTYITAETLRIITGVDPGYSKQFVDSYTASDEDERIRQDKIAQWRKWYRENKVR